MTLPVDLAVTLVPLCTTSISLGASRTIESGPRGKRVIVDVAGGSLTGDRLSGRLVGGAAGDWVTVSPDGRYGMIDVRATFETDDGALVYVEYDGRILFGKDGHHTTFAAPRFETGDPRYAWLNRIQAVGKGQADAAARTIRYQLYELA